jgi:hypothetical protein
MIGEIKRDKSKHIVSVLDLTGLEMDMISFLVEKGLFTAEKNAIQTHYTLGLVEKNGKHYIVDNDGVGSFDALEDTPYEIGWYLSTLDENGKEKSFGMYPVASSVVDYNDMIKETKVTEKVTLDKFIRTFGGRLEVNFGEWERFLSLDK